MSLIKCPDCRKDISDAAPACIYCGRPKNAAPPAPSAPPKKSIRTPFRITLKTLGVLLSIAGLLLLISGHSPEFSVISLSLGIVLIISATLAPWFKPQKTPAKPAGQGDKPLDASDIRIPEQNQRQGPPPQA